MLELNGVLRDENKAGKAGKAGKGAMLGFLAIGLACMGCCLTPILGTLAFAGLGASMLALIQSHSTLVALMAAGIGLTMLWLWRKRSKACCASPDADCSGTGCG